MAKKRRTLDESNSKIVEKWVEQELSDPRPDIKGGYRVVGEIRPNKVKKIKRVSLEPRKPATPRFGFDVDIDHLRRRMRDDANAPETLYGLCVRIDGRYEEVKLVRNERGRILVYLGREIHTLGSFSEYYLISNEENDPFINEQIDLILMLLNS